MKLSTLVQENYDKLNENDLYIWSYILHHKEECRNLSIQELAARCNVSHTMISRFAKKLGLEGYGELKLHLKWENGKTSCFDSQEIKHAYYDYIKTMDAIIDYDFSELHQLLENAGRIFSYGTGEVQKAAAKELKRTLLSAHYIVHVLEGKSELKLLLNYVKPNDVFFLYSLSGNNSIINDFANRLKVRGAKIITITRVGNNELSMIGDISLQFYCHPVLQRENQSDIYMTTQFFLINEFIFLKLMELK